MCTFLKLLSCLLSSDHNIVIAKPIALLNNYLRVKLYIKFIYLFFNYNEQISKLF